MAWRDTAFLGCPQERCRAEYRLPPHSKAFANLPREGHVPAKVAQTFLSALFAKAQVIHLREYVYGGQAG